MKATNKLLAILLTVCMLLAMPLSINVSAAEQLHIEDAYLGASGTADENYLFIKFSEKADLQTRTNEALIGVSVFNAAGTQTARLVIYDPQDETETPGSSDANGLYKVRLKVPANWGTYDSVATWLNDKFINATGEGLRLICYVSDPITNTAVVDGSIPTFKGATTDTYLRNDTPGYVYGSTGKEATQFDMTAKYDKTPITLQSLTRNSLTDFTLTFSEAVTLTGGSNFGLCVMKDGKIISSKNLVVGSWRGNTNGSTYTETWRLGFHHNDYSINNGNSIFTYAMGEFTDELKAQGAQLCFYIADQSSTTADGLIDSVYTQTGKKLKNDSGINSTDTKETYFIPVQVEDMGFTPTAYVSNGTLLLSTPGLSGIGGWSGAYIYLRAYDDNGNILSINSKAAQWRLSVNSSARYNGASSLYCSSELLITDTEGHGVSRYDTIVALLDQEYPDGYNLEMVVDDSTATKNGFVENMAQYNSSLGQVSAYLLASELYSTDTLDVAVIPFGEMVTVDSVDVYDSGKAILTFSHDIDIDALIAAHTNYKDFFLTISTPGENSYVVDTNDYDGDGNTTEPLAQTAMGDIQRYGDNNNKIMVTVDPVAYEKMMDIYGAKTESDNWAIRMRIEMETGYVKNVGKIPVNDNIVATKEGVLSPYMPAFWGTDVISGRVWTDVNLVDAADGAISVNGVQTNDLSAITAAPAGSEIIMIDNAVVESGGFNVPSGVVLDLNGKTITMSENTAINVIGTIMDNTDGGALIKVANKNTATVAIPGSNPQMPLYDTADGGYRLFHKEFKAQGVKEGSNANPADTTAMRYGVHLHFDNMKAYELLAAGGTDVKLTLNLYAEGYVDVPLYTFQESTLKEYGQSCLNATAEKPLSGKTIVLTVFGIDKLNGTPLNVSATLNFMGTTAIGDAVPVV